MSTYVPIQAITLSSAASSVEFTNIPQTYTDLIVVINMGQADGNNSPAVRINNNTGTNYSITEAYGNGTSALSARSSNSTELYFGYSVTGPSTRQGIARLHFMNYSNTTTHKVVISRMGSIGGSFPGSNMTVGTWRSTAAINSILFKTSNGSNYIADSTFTLYGMGTGSPKAFGGTTITTDGTYWYHAFQSSGVFEPLQNITTDILVVAGGGGGGCNMAGGGGAGGLVYHSATSLSANNFYNIVIGAGGTGSNGNAVKGTNGINSQFGSLTAAVGGGGGGSLNLNFVTGSNGGSGGGGAGGYETGTGGSGGTATSGQGSNGGSGASGSGSLFAGGGGGGFSAVGGNGSGSESSAVGGNGGNGTGLYSSFGSATKLGQLSGGIYYFSGGGGGGVPSDASAPQSTGGLGGGGAGGKTNGYNGGAASPIAGSSNTGGGGGGGNNGGTNNTVGAPGGSGLIIVRYPV